MRSYCGREERQVTLRFPSASATVSLHKFPPAKNLGIPVLPPTTHLPFHSLRSAVLTCTKNGQPCRRSSTELHKREKNQNSNISRTMRVKRMTVAEGKRVGIGRFPNFHKTGRNSIMARSAFWYDVAAISTMLPPNPKSTIKQLSKSPPI